MSTHLADSHDLIRVHGARENNLKDISVELPKRRLTVFTGVSGSGKSSLVFSTIAAESQRMINETYSSFVQGFMPTLARPDVDVLDGLTTAIIIDQERMGANVRSTVGTATDANAMLRILFSRLGQAAYRFLAGVLVQRRLDQRGRRGHRRTCRSDDQGAAQLFHHRRHVPALRGPRFRHRYRPDRALRRQQIIERGRADHSRIQHGGLVRADLQPAAAISTRTSRSTRSPRNELNDLLYKEPTKIKVDGINLTYEGLIPKTPEVYTVQGCRRAATAHPGLCGAGRHLYHLSRLRRHPALRGRPIVEDQRHQHRRRLQDADLRPGRPGCGSSTSHPWRRCSPRSGTRWTRSSRSASATSPSTGHRARSPAGRRSESR